MSTIDWLEAEVGPINNDDVVYSLNKISDRHEVRKLCNNGWLILNLDTKSDWLKFAVLSFYCSDSGGKDIKLQNIFHGEGPTGSLRECRHTWWGEDGYLFYPDGPIITAAFKALSEFFDDMTSDQKHSNET